MFIKDVEPSNWTLFFKFLAKGDQLKVEPINLDFPRRTMWGYYFSIRKKEKKQSQILLAYSLKEILQNSSLFGGVVLHDALLSFSLQFVSFIHRWGCDRSDGDSPNF